MEGILYRPIDIARALGVHKNTVLNVAERLKIEPARTTFGHARFTESQADDIASNIQSRQKGRAAEFVERIG